MIHYAKIISCYAADTSGVCSALYELGGMTVVHDASGCNSTYSTHDEPRWYDMDSMIYVSGLTEIDAVMGNDERLISDVCDAAEELNPEFITLCGSPMPAMTGTDFDAIASVTEQRCGIKTFGLHTNGMHSYIDGASEAFEKIADYFCKKSGRKNNKPTVNIIGATPLDFSSQKIINSMKNWLCESGFDVGSCMAMGDSLDRIIAAGDSDCNLVISGSGLAAAELLEKKFGIPYVVGVPYGKKYSEILAADIIKAIETKSSLFSSAERSNSQKSDIAVVGEAVMSASLARAIEGDTGLSARVICTLEKDKRFFADGDLCIADERFLAEEFAKCGIIIADGLFKPICPENVRFYSLAHEAFSGRCFRKTVTDIIGTCLKVTPHKAR